MLPLLAACMALIFLLKEDKVEAWIRLPLILALFALMLAYNPVLFMLNGHTDTPAPKDRKIMIASRIIMFLLIGMSAVLLFADGGLALDVARILAVISCLFLVVLLFNKTDTMKLTLIEYWAITSLFLGLTIFLR